MDEVEEFFTICQLQGHFDWEFDTETKIFVYKVLMEFNDVSKTGLWTKISQRVPEIYHYPHRNPRKLKILISITTAFLVSSEAQIIFLL